MTAWLDFIGKAYYKTPRVFLQEAKAQGATRRVPLRTLERMNWLDKVVCVQRENGHKSASVFAFFPITLLSGLSSEVTEALAMHYKLELIDAGGDEVARGCGDYLTGPTYRIKDAPLPAIARSLRAMKERNIDIGQPMVGCHKEDICEAVKPYPFLKDVPYQLAIRPFDWQSFQSQLIEQTTAGGKRAMLRGQFYLDKADHETSGESDGDAQVVSAYRRK
jgi:hypothetical protein